MRWISFLFCCLFMAFTLAGANAPVMGADLPNQSYPEERSEDVLPERQVAEFCADQRYICRKICYLRFRDDQIGCPQKCESRAGRCTRTGCYRWTEPELLIAEKFGGYKCNL